MKSLTKEAFKNIVLIMAGVQGGRGFTQKDSTDP
jgi:hypothetical protein